VKLLHAHAAGLWLRSTDPTWQLRFCAGYRIPRWLTDRLVVQPPAECLVSLLHGGGYRMLDTDDLGMPATVTGGRSLAVIVNEPATPPLGVVAVFTANDHRWSPEELRILQDVAMLLATIISQRIVIDDLERTLEQVQRCAAGHGRDRSTWLPASDPQVTAPADGRPDRARCRQPPTRPSLPSPCRWPPSAMLVVKATGRHGVHARLPQAKVPDDRGAGGVSVTGPADRYRVIVAGLARSILPRTFAADCTRSACRPVLGTVTPRVSDRRTR
jgi:hypothetical protein